MGEIGKTQLFCLVEKVSHASYDNTARETEMFRETEIISVCGAFERHYEGFMKAAFELDLEGCKAIYGLNIKTPASREQPQSGEFPRMDVQNTVVLCCVPCSLAKSSWEKRKQSYIIYYRVLKE